jgi:hypothetical protein
MGGVSREVEASTPLGSDIASCPVLPGRVLREDDDEEA